MTMSIEEYRKAVRSCAINKTDYLFHNEGAEHARIILSNIFMNAYQHVRMASNSLTNTEIVGSDEYRNALMAFLNRKDTYLEIMLTNIPSEEQATKEGSIFAMLYYHPAYKEGRIKIKDAKGKSFKANSHQRINFCTGDTMMYRIETDINKWMAVANFNDFSKTKILSEKFDSVFSQLAELQLNNYFEHN